VTKCSSRYALSTGEFDFFLRRTGPEL